MRSIELTRDFTSVDNKNGQSHNLRFLVTGGCGYFAFELAKTLREFDVSVTLLDIQLPKKIKPYLSRTFKFIKGDVRDYASVYKSFEDIDCVFHAASFGMSGADQFCKEATEEVNVGGTRNVLRACQERGITRLIYTSSYNVVFDGTPIVNGDESLCVSDISKFVDYYSLTKYKADQLILEANGSKVTGGQVLRTCSLRPAGIYGPGERRHIQRIAEYIESGMMIMKLGNAVCDWVHVDNLIQCHLLAVRALSPASGYIAAGKCYFVSDDQPLHVFAFLKPLFNELGYEVPKYKCPFYVSYMIAFIVEMIICFIRPIFKFIPFLTRNEVLKMEFDHYHSMENAKKDLGYRPKPYEFADVVKLFLQQRQSERPLPSRDWKWIGTTLTFALILVSIVLQFCLYKDMRQNLP